MEADDRGVRTRQALTASVGSHSFCDPLGRLTHEDFVLFELGKGTEGEQKRSCPQLF